MVQKWFLVVGQIITTGIIIGMNMEDNYFHFYWDYYFLPQFRFSAPPRNHGLVEDEITHFGPLFDIRGMGLYSVIFQVLYIVGVSSIHIDF